MMNNQMGIKSKTAWKAFTMPPMKFVKTPKKPENWVNHVTNESTQWANGNVGMLLKMLDIDIDLLSR
ncbi:Uncharacterised protein [Mycobacteroides abscessus subsp. abscessus]|nr:Uncharacterised protein [Mycobacteroides abscessus subsp. abscessus]